MPAEAGLSSYFWRRRRPKAASAYVVARGRRAVLHLFSAPSWVFGTLPAVCGVACHRLSLGSVIRLGFLCDLHRRRYAGFFPVADPRVGAWRGRHSCSAAPHFAPRPQTANGVALIGLLLIVVGILYPYPFTPSTPVAAPVVIGTALLV